MNFIINKNIKKLGNYIFFGKIFRKFDKIKIFSQENQKIIYLLTN